MAEHDAFSKPSAVLAQHVLSDRQLQAALARGTDVVVRAGAGTGKTRTLVGRYLTLLEDGVPLRSIVAVTFTRKAAREMRNRVREVVSKVLSEGNGADERWSEISAGLDAARIGTIHGLCAEILRNHPAEMGLDPDFTTLDETQGALLLIEAVDAALAWAVTQEQALLLLETLGEPATRDLLISLIRQRAAAAAALERVAGEDMTAVWSMLLAERQQARAAALLADPELAAARIRLSRIRGADDSDRCEIARQTTVAALDNLAQNFNPASATWREDFARLSAVDLRGGSQRNWGGKEQLAEVKADISLLRDSWKKDGILLLAANELDEQAAAILPGLALLFKYAAGAYQVLKDERAALDFDDLESLAIDLLTAHPDARGYWQSVVQALLVDEFQDTNERQRELIRALCPEPGKLFIVGDAKQSIYRFRGADVSVFRREEALIAAGGGIVIDLDTSYRAHATLLEGMNDLLAPVLGEADPARPYHAPFDALLPVADKVSCAGLAAPFVEMHLALGSKETALPAAAAALVERLHGLWAATDLDYGDVAILCRASGSFRFYEDALDAAGVPYVTVAGRGFFARPEIRDLLNALRAIEDPHDDLALAGLLRSPAVGLTDADLFRLVRARPAGGSLWDFLRSSQTADLPREEEAMLAAAVALIERLNGRAGRAAVADILKEYLDETHYRAALRRAGETRALRNVAKLLEDVHRSERVNIADFLEYADALRDSGSREGEARSAGEGVVQIMTIHQAKGLEFPVVVLGDSGATGSTRKSPFLLDPDVGLVLPLKEEKTYSAAFSLAELLDKDMADAEQARLLYVALTRAQQILLLSGHCNAVNKDGSLRSSGWLRQLADITGLNNESWSGAAPDGDAAHSRMLWVGETAVALRLVEGAYSTPVVPRQEKVPEAAPGPAEFELARPLPPPPQIEEQDAVQRVWDVIPRARQPRAPQWLIGTIVHEALALWRFPDDGFDEWAIARAQALGLQEQSQLIDAAQAAARLLRRFQESNLFAEMQGAQRRLHELPYSLQENGRLEIGRIDALVLFNEQWFVIDFKIDEVRDELQLERLLGEKDYTAQVQRYGRAVQQLLGVSPLVLLCFLDAPEDLYLRPVAM
jgi:ATP-dependent helicase/nuclease subunit A